MYVFFIQIKRNLNDNFSCYNHNNVRDLQLALDMKSIMKDAEIALKESPASSFRFCHDAWLNQLPCDDNGNIQPLLSSDLVRSCQTA